MFAKVLVCLDGSPAAEKILPLAQAIASGPGSTVDLLRVVGNNEELSAAESYMRERAGVFRATFRFLISPDPAIAIIDELEQNPRAIVALTTHGRSAWGQALLGSVALKVIRGAKRPVILYRPRAGTAPAKITTIMLALDGTEFSEKIIPSAVSMAKTLGSGIILVQTLTLAAGVGVGGPNLPTPHVLGSSYLPAQAGEN